MPRVTYAIAACYSHKILFSFSFIVYMCEIERDLVVAGITDASLSDTTFRPFFGVNVLF